MFTAEEFAAMSELRRLVCADYDWPAIRSMLDHVQRVYPNHARAIIQPAFERVLENASFETGTAMLDLFIAHGADVSNPAIFWQVSQELELEPAPKSLERQVVAVLRSLIRAGADPRAVIDDMLTYQSSGVHAMAQAVQRALDDVEEDRSLESNTAPAQGVVSRRQGRL